MPTKVVVDPITRIEGHLRIEAQADNGRISKAWASSTQFRGIEIIMQGRDPRDAWAFTQRICGVCTVVHAVASCRAVEDALDIRIPPNANLIRNLVHGMQFVQDHVIHFYHLHALDWVDVTSALKADPAETARVAQSLSPWPNNSATYFAEVKNRLNTFVNSGQLGIFTNGYWGHPAYKLPPAVNLLAVAHYLEALDWQRDVIRLHTIFGGKNPHPNFLVGGMASAINLNDTATINAERLTDIQSTIVKAKRFVEQVYWPDLVAIAGFYKEWAAIGGGVPNYMTVGEFPEKDVRDTDALYFPRGIILNNDLSKVLPYDQQQVKEFITSRGTITKQAMMPVCTRMRVKPNPTTPVRPHRGRICRITPSTPG
jgi:Ni,Fe-hydrogenase I large subunit